MSPIDGIPLGIKDIIETVDLPTEQGSPLFIGWRTGRDAASVAALRETGAVILGKVVTTEFAATEPRGTRNPWDTERTPGGSSSGSAAAVACGMVPAALGPQVVGSILRPASFCGCVGSQAERRRDQPWRKLRLLQPELHRHTRRFSRRRLARRDQYFRTGGRRSGLSRTARPARAAVASAPARRAVLETAGWELAAADARRAFDAAVARLADAGIAIANRHADRAIDEVEGAISDAVGLTRDINAWAGRWPLNTYRNRDRTKLNQSALDRLATAEAMTLANYGAAIARRQRSREIHARLAARYDAAITLAAPGPAPIGLGSTGNPIVNVPGPLLGIPALSLPLLSADDLPLGLQVMNFAGEDAWLFAIGAALGRGAKGRDREIVAD